MATIETPDDRSVGLRMIHAIPVVGWMIRDVSRDLGNLPYALVTIITLIVLAFQVWGPVVLTLLALCIVPLMFAFFIAISWPFPARK